MSGNFNENAGALLPMDAKVPAADAPVRAPARAKSRLLGGVTAGLLLAGIALLGWLSFFLAASRIYQVDECLNVFVAHMIAARQSAPGMDLFQLLLAWLLPMGGRAEDLFGAAR